MSTHKFNSYESLKVEERSRVEGFALTLDPAFKFNGQLHLAVPFIQNLYDNMDSLHVSRIFDNLYKLPDVSRLMRINERDNTERNEQNDAFEETLRAH